VNVKENYSPKPPSLARRVFNRLNSAFVFFFETPGEVKTWLFSAAVALFECPSTGRQDLDESSSPVGRVSTPPYEPFDFESIDATRHARRMYLKSSSNLAHW
jgi:hypothetical protein